MNNIAMRAYRPGDRKNSAHVAAALYKKHKAKIARRRAAAARQVSLRTEELSTSKTLPQKSVLRNEPAMGKLADEDGETENKRKRGKLKRRSALEPYINERRRRRINRMGTKRRKSAERYIRGRRATAGRLREAFDRGIMRPGERLPAAPRYSGVNPRDRLLSAITGTQPKLTSGRNPPQTWLV